MNNSRVWQELNFGINTVRLKDGCVWVDGKTHEMENVKQKKYINPISKPTGYKLTHLKANISVAFKCDFTHQHIESQES